MRAADFSRWWARCYTRGLPAESRDRRRAEIESDLFEHAAAANGHGVGAAMVGRTLRGVGDDVLWRLREGQAMGQGQQPQGSPSGLRAAWAAATQAWFTPFAVLLGLFNVAGAVAVIADNNGKMPGRVIGPVILLTLAAALFAGLVLRWRSGTASGVATPDSDKSTLRARLGLGAIAVLGIVGVIAGVMGSVILMLAGLVALGGAAALASRQRNGPKASAPSKKPQRVLLADALILVGTLPALGLWWLIVPPIVALVVIAGVLGTGPGTRPQPAV